MQLYDIFTLLYSRIGAAVVRLDRDGRRSLDLLRWGLVPWWAKGMGVRCINAMAETVATKPAFRDGFLHGQRCIVPVDGFYGLPLAMSGLWERWKDRASGDIVQSFTIITTVPKELCGAPARPHACNPTAQQVADLARPARGRP